MAFIGIIAEKKEICDIEKNLKNYFNNLGQKHTLIAIQNSNIENIKNIKFETLLISSNSIDKQKQKNLEQIISNASFVVLNTDTVNTNLIESAKQMVITYGFGVKTTVTMSSVDDEKIILCIQRGFENVNKVNIEPQEIIIKYNELLGNKYSKMGCHIIKLLYESQKK